jgi:hypothetical protein
MGNSIRLVFAPRLRMSSSDFCFSFAVTALLTCVNTNRFPAKSAPAQARQPLRPNFSMARIMNIAINFDCFFFSLPAWSVGAVGKTNCTKACPFKKNSLAFGFRVLSAIVCSFPGWLLWLVFWCVRALQQRNNREKTPNPKAPLIEIYRARYSTRTHVHLLWYYSRYLGTLDVHGNGYHGTEYVHVYLGTYQVRVYTYAYVPWY